MVCVCVCAASHLLPEQVRAADFGFRSATQASSPSTPGSACSQVQPPRRERSSPWNCRPSSLPTAPACSGEREAGRRVCPGSRGRVLHDTAAPLLSGISAPAGWQQPPTHPSCWGSTFPARGNTSPARESHVLPSCCPKLPLFSVTGKAS